MKERFMRARFGVVSNGWVTALAMVLATPLGAAQASATGARQGTAQRAYDAQTGISADPSRATYADVKAFLADLAAKHPETTRLFTLGDSDSGEKIVGVAIGNGPVHNLVVATHHGNEYGSTEVARGFAQSMAEQPIAGQTVYVVPVLNIAGYNHKDRREPARGRTWDPNRNYPGPCGTEGPLTLKSTQALADFVAKQGIVASATLHTFSPAVVYPWGISTHDLSTPYDDQFRQLCQAATVESQYAVGNSTEVIYPADGAYEDYAFWKHGIWSLLFELGDTHSPDMGEVKQLVQVNVPGLRRFFEQAPAQRAEKHDFTGKCDRSFAMLMRDLHDE
jgi:predicted deacylase